MGPPQSTVVWAPRSPGCLPPTPQQDQHHALAAPPAPPTPPSSLQGWPPTPPPGDVPWEGARAPGNCWEGLWVEQGRGSRGSPTPSHAALLSGSTHHCVRFFLNKRRQQDWGWGRSSRRTDSTRWLAVCPFLAVQVRAHAHVYTHTHGGHTKRCGVEAVLCLLLRHPGPFRPPGC